MNSLCSLFFLLASLLWDLYTVDQPQALIYWTVAWCLVNHLTWVCYL